MKLSQLMYTGLAESQPLRCSHISHYGGVFCADVLGICLWKLYGESWFNNQDTLEKVYPELKTDVEHPITGKQVSLYLVVIQLTDDFEWSREEIIRYVERLGY